MKSLLDAVAARLHFLESMENVGLAHPLKPFFVYQKLQAGQNLLVITPTDRDSLILHQQLLELNSFEKDSIGDNFTDVSSSTLINPSNDGVTKNFAPTHFNQHLVAIFPTQSLTADIDLKVLAKQRLVLSQLDQLRCIIISANGFYSDIANVSKIASSKRSELEDSTLGVTTLNSIDQCYATRIPNTTNTAITYDELLTDLKNKGFHRVELVEERGEYAVRGSVIDVFSPLEEHPYRFDFWGDKFDSVKYFSLLDQRSLADITVSECIIPDIRFDKADDLSAGNNKYSNIDQSLTETVSSELSNMSVDFSKNLISQPVDDALNTVFLSDLLPENWRTINYDQPRVEALWNQLAKLYNFALRAADIDCNLTEFDVMNQPSIGSALTQTYRRIENLIASIKTETDKHIYLLYANKAMHERLYEVLVNCSASLSNIRFLPAEQLNSFALEDLLVLNVEQLLTFRVSTSKPEKLVRRKNELQLVDLSPGDFVVHERHGIGRYIGLQFDDGNRREYLVVEYKPYKRGFPADQLLVPTEHVNWLTKYVGNNRPRINKLGGAEWALTKKRVQKYIKHIAFDLIRLHGLRQAYRGHAFSLDTLWQQELESNFEFVETPDQKTIIAQVKKDMERARPMDRIILGDVGFGKTEIAVRAAFKAVQDQKQVAILVPTTVLATQHYETFRARMEPFPVRIELLSRFQSDKEARRIRQELAEGKVDIVIGTHTLIQASTKFQNLGLIVVDEEQRFGVEHKETLKAVKINVDVLYLSATPIPRTLEMALSGLKDLSVITTPPENRQAIKTLVEPYSDDLVYRSILAEVMRGGQVFYLYNRVKTIDQRLANLQKFFNPDIVTFAVAHGQMPQRQLDQTLHKFYRKEIDVLVCTSIVENGLDVVNANTVIVEDAQRFGISQLHQIRGRVGRSSTQAYAYFLYPNSESVSATAFERFSAIKQNSALGAGFQLAMKDLELRGAGNLLGVEQSGQMEGVGFDLFMKMLSDEIEQLKRSPHIPSSWEVGLGVVETQEFDQSKLSPSDPVADSLNNLSDYSKSIVPDSSNEQAQSTNGQVSQSLIIKRIKELAIPLDYIPNHELRLEMYQKMANSQTREELKDVLDEMSDRYGPLPKEFTVGF
ncbi:MAG: DEAD/DEAH box helicase [Bifidobacteriaceae bacterium]|jgi:transcription-repair coupling factor (superfamily II helicase)|nr:DEAD/DEAH box helicase [Bifidobacteriaceae bacterium]